MRRLVSPSVLPSVRPSVTLYFYYFFKAIKWLIEPFFIRNVFSYLIHLNGIFFTDAEQFLLYLVEFYQTDHLLSACQGMDTETYLGSLLLDRNVKKNCLFIWGHSDGGKSLIANLICR